MAERAPTTAEARLVVRDAARPRSGRCDAASVVGAIDVLLRVSDGDAVHELLLEGLLRDSAERYAEHVAPLMRAIPAAAFDMGTPAAEAGHFCGESPRHRVELSPYSIGVIPVTNELYALFDPDRAVALRRSERGLPVVGVTWFEAALFALWVGCRLPTEAEWEYACGSGAQDEWCCADAGDLRRYAWFSENADSCVREAGRRAPNAFGLHDLHGNVWEWCRDAYDEDWYARSPVRDPIASVADATSVAAPGRHKVARGGSVYALAEMCRTRYRLHDPPWYWADDLGFRLAR